MKASPFIEFFIKHNTAANLLMVLMVVIGIISIDRLNRQFFPTFDVEVVGVNVTWSGATAEDVEPISCSRSNLNCASSTMSRR